MSCRAGRPPPFLPQNPAERDGHTAPSSDAISLRVKHLWIGFWGRWPQAGGGRWQLAVEVGFKHGLPVPGDEIIGGTVAMIHEKATHDARC